VLAIRREPRQVVTEQLGGNLGRYGPRVGQGCSWWRGAGQISYRNAPWALGGRLQLFCHPREGRDGPQL